VRTLASLVTIAAALAVLVAVSSPGAGAGPHPADRHPPPLRSRDLLRASGGVMWWVTGGCRLVRLRMATLRPSRADGRYCRAWPAPDGSVVLAASGTGPTLSPPVRLVVINGTSLRPVAETAVAGALVGPVAWSPDSLLASVCVSAGPEGVAVQLLAAPWQRVTTESRRCRPVFTRTATRLTSDGRSIFEGGANLHLDAALAAAVGRQSGSYRVTALAATPHGLIAAVRARTAGGVQGSPAAIVVVDRRSGTTTATSIPHGASELGVSPDGRAFWYRDAASGIAALELLVAGGEPVGLPRRALAYAWSPDGRYAAAAEAGLIRVVDTHTGAAGIISAKQVTSLSWTR
jgi:hypothetical protein